ncbi:MAG TPA: hypothetical protein VH396_12315 [Chitinophagaceae bacterium]|jgi:hypothetical protein
MKRRYWQVRAFPLIILGVLAIVALLSFIVMSLWNNILVSVLHIGVINFWQALGLLVLAKILFGGFPGWRGRHGYGHFGYRRKEMYEKWQTMTPEEREKFKQEWRDRCRGVRREEVDKKTNAGIE